MPMNIEAHQKITTAHLSRLAYLYVRQSTLRQVLENTESTRRQYALRERAAALGWPLDRIVVIDSDIGQSGASAADRGRAAHRAPSGHGAEATLTHEQPSGAGAAGVEARSAWRRSLRVRGKRGHLIKILARRHRHVALRQAVGARQVYLAIAGRWHGGNNLSSAGLHA